jgi:hypothetical protein
MIAILEHAGEALLLFIGAWRFVLSRSYREKKLREWQAAADTLGGKLVIGVEVVAATATGVVLPAWLIAAVLASC